MKILGLLIVEKIKFDSITKKLDVIGIFNTIGASKFPARHEELVIVVIAEGDVSNTSKKHEFLVEITKNGKVIAKNINTILTNERHYYINRFKNIIFQEEGIYIINAKIDNKEELSTSLHLKLVN